MTKYNALDNQANAARLYWLLWYEDKDIESTASYEAYLSACDDDTDYSTYESDVDNARWQTVKDLMVAIKAYVGEDALAAAKLLEVRI